MTIYCVCEFSKDEDTTTLSKKQFNEDEWVPYPEFSLILGSYYPVEKELLNVGGTQDDLNYIMNLYDGSEWNKTMSTLDLDKVNSRTKQLVIDSIVLAGLGEKGESNADLTSTSLRWDGSKVITLKCNQKDVVNGMSVWINLEDITSIYATLQFPNQQYKPNMRIILPIYTQIPKSTFSMFYMREIETMRYREKSKSPCYDWNHYDSVLWKHIMQEVGCTPFYRLENFGSNCSRSQLQTIGKIIHEEKYPSPCNEITKYEVTTDTHLTDIDQEDFGYSGIGKKLENITDWARITVVFDQKWVKEIHQYRAYTVQSLIGNAGGYVGLFIGVAAYDIPSLVQNSYYKLKRLR